MKYEAPELFVFPGSYVLLRISAFKFPIRNSPQKLTYSVNQIPEIFVTC